MAAAAGSSDALTLARAEYAKAPRPEAAFKLALELYRAKPSGEGTTDQAEAMLREALPLLDPSQISTWQSLSLLAVVHQDLKQWDDALTASAECLKLINAEEVAVKKLPKSRQGTLLTSLSRRGSQLSQRYLVDFVAKGDCHYRPVPN